ncbi:MAG TPA: quinol:electron acceptor oxidoreductase subunit ActD [Syntrophorhabdaceae bacterium]|jgi:hypothetical protein
MAKNIAVYGIYKTREMVERAVEALKNAGFRSEDISVLFPESGGTKEFAIEKETKAPEGAATGAGTGAVIGGALGWLVGIGLLAIPGLGPFIAAGPIMGALAGAGAGGVAGGIAGALIGMGIPEYEANRYEGRIKQGGILLSVHADDRDWKNRGKEILQKTGAEDIGYKSEAGADYDKSDKPRPDKPREAQSRNEPTRPVTGEPLDRPPADTLHTPPGERVGRRSTDTFASPIKDPSLGD